MIYWLILPFAVNLVTSEDPILQTNIGKFVGFTLEFEAGKVDVFYGVPFAKAPIGDLRFEKPIDADFLEKRYAKSLPPACYQQDYGRVINKSEDCLYLNIFRPHKKDPKGYPSLFFIHGGAFQAGSALEHTTEYAAEHYATQGITLIFPQYRLSISGFGSTNSADLPGNLGLWDLQKALQFLHQNSDSLYLDPTRVTVGGYSAGSAATSALTISPHTRDLFLQSIQFSGSIFSEWAFSNRGVIHTERVIKLLGCDGGEVKKCLKSKTAEELEDATAQAHDAEGEINSFDYTPKIDGDFFPADVAELLDSAKPKNSLMSLTEHEGLLFTIYFTNEVEIFHHSLTKEQKEKFSKKDFEGFISNVIAPRKVFGEKHEEVAKKIIDFYMDLDKKDGKKHYYLDLYGKVLGDVMFVIPQLSELKKRMAKDWDVYHILTVHNDYLEVNTLQVELLNATHSFEYYYLFGAGFLGPHEFTEDDLKYKKLLIDSVINFVKTGSPKSEENPNFVKVDKEHPLVYTELSSEAIVKNNLFGREFEFWSELSNDYEFDIIRGKHKRSHKIRSEL
uniref:COesterase domain-containing protein n=2 Tax=Bursaphelenchus xylophilus TaxID=6326 RepID=A0A1I7RSM9_BURXY